MIANIFFDIKDWKTSDTTRKHEWSNLMRHSQLVLEEQNIAAKTAK